MLLSMMAVRKLTYGYSNMNCWHCNTKLIWGGDVDIDEDSSMHDEYLIETNLHCPECNSFFLVLISYRHLESNSKLRAISPSHLSPFARSLSLS